LIVTSREDIADLLDATKECFIQKGLMSAWERVVAVVVQPGIDFSDMQVARYRPQLAAELVAYHSSLPGIMTYEVHAADYQSETAIGKLVMDHFTIMKVGPCLTNAYREAIYALAQIEIDWLKGKKGYRLSGIRHILESVMKNNPEHWQNYYSGEPLEVAFLRQYSYRDRIRYYWNYPEVETAVKRLLKNLHRPIPFVLIKQYFPDLYPAIESGEISPTVYSLIKGRIGQTLAPYFRACKQSAA
jgi:D-tagatose-1,6-bisphosphate aldolase subunit GatZ/KbaZ